MTPVLMQQFRLYYDQQKPIGVVLWARVSAEVGAMLAAGTTKLRPQDILAPTIHVLAMLGRSWRERSGDRLWTRPDRRAILIARRETAAPNVVEVIAPSGGAEEMVRDLKAKIFPERELKYVALGASEREDGSEGDVMSAILKSQSMRS